MDINAIPAEYRPPMPEATEIDRDEEQRRKVARDFEGVLIHQILDNMSNTIPESEDEDSSTEHIKGMFWSFLADAVAENGGFGLWRQIYESMPAENSQPAADGKLDTSA